MPELTALFLPLAAWTIASRRGEWGDLLAATMVTVALRDPDPRLHGAVGDLRLAPAPPRRRRPRLPSCRRSDCRRLGPSRALAEDLPLVLEQEAPQVAPLEQRSPLGLEHRLARQAGDPLRELDPAASRRRPATSRTIPSLWASGASTRRPGQAELLGDGRRQHGARGRVARRDPARQLRVAEHGSRRADPQVAQQRQREPAGDAPGR